MAMWLLLGLTAFFVVVVLVVDFLGVKGKGAAQAPLGWRGRIEAVLLANAVSLLRSLVLVCFIVASVGVWRGEDWFSWPKDISDSVLAPTVFSELGMLVSLAQDYQAEFGRSPDSLQALVDAGMLDELPDGATGTVVPYRFVDSLPGPIVVAEFKHVWISASPME